MKTLAIAGALSPVVIFLLSLLYKLTGKAVAVAVAWVFPAEILDPGVLGVLAEYAARKKKRVGLSGRNWTAKYLFVQPAGEYRHVPFLQMWLTTRVMFVGRAMVIIHYRSAHSGSDCSTMVARYLRGTLDFQKFVLDAFAARTGAAVLSKRFAVYNIPENGRSDEEWMTKGAAPSPTPVPVDHDRSQLVTEAPVGYDMSELGVPVPPHPFDSYSESEQTREIRNDFEFWLSRRRWYEQRGIAWRRGYLLHGAPGTGKTSLVRSLAQEYDVPVYRFDIASLNTAEFRRRVRDVNSKPAIFLFDDIDGIYSNREVPQPKARPDGRYDDDEITAYAKRMSGVTFDGFLDVLDGVEQLDGIAVFVTTNYPERLDAALTRPGRLDLHVAIVGPDAAGRRKIVERIVDHPETVEAVLREVPGTASPAVLREAAIEAALRDEWGKKGAAA